jgi:elongation factor P
VSRRFMALLLVGWWMFPMSAAEDGRILVAELCIGDEAAFVELACLDAPHRHVLTAFERGAGDQKATVTRSASSRPGCQVDEYLVGDVQLPSVAGSSGDRFSDPDMAAVNRSSASTLSVTLIATNQFKNGMHVDVDGTVFKIVEFQHVKPGKGGAFVRTKLKRVDDGAVIDRTFRAGEKFRPVRTEARRMQYLYSDGSDAHFMDTQTYDQLAIPEESVRESLKWIMPNEEIDLLYVDEAPSDVQVPSAVELTVSETQPGVKGDTASGGGDKPATLESGVIVRVPLFVNEGDRVRVDTRSGEYVSRA